MSYHEIASSCGDMLLLQKNVKNKRLFPAIILGREAPLVCHSGHYLFRSATGWWACSPRVAGFVYE